MGISYRTNVQDEPRLTLARSVLLGARSMTVRVVGSGDWFGPVVFISDNGPNRPNRVKIKIADHGQGQSICRQKCVLSASRSIRLP